MRRLRLCLIIFALLIDKNVSAAEGCLVGNRMYTSLASVSILAGPAFTTTSYIDSNGRCWSPAPSGSCQVCNGTAAVVAGLLVCAADLFGPRDGIIYNGNYYASFTVINCNFDDYSWALGTATGIFGFIFIRRKKIR
ncbi:hypothetical protein [Pedobacter sp. Leaf132]|uniref:hypothetical protein n=1 Tax=Pedobacter sp. Leaf132 TaxID=2876557 RepID=UPI001E41D919|nr:hypothetical protein [Pedobacter sp. Leaf132]